MQVAACLSVITIPLSRFGAEREESKSAMNDAEGGLFLSNPEAVSELSHHLADILDKGSVDGGTERLYRRALRKIARLFDADSSCLFLIDPDGNFSSPIIRVPPESEWSDLESRFRRSRRDRPMRFLFGKIWRGGRLAALLAVRRESGYHPDCRDDIRRLAQLLSSAVSRHDRLRLLDIQSRIDRRIMVRGHHPKDVLYRLLDEFRLLTQYDHTGSFFRCNDGTDSLTLVAEKVLWRKGGSSRVGASIALSPEDASAISDSGINAYRLQGQTWYTVDTDEIAITISESARGSLLGPSSLDQAMVRQTEPFEQSVLLAPVNGGDRLLGVLRLSGRFSNCFNDYSVGVIRALLPHSALMLGRLTGEGTPMVRPRVFLSYVRDDSVTVDRLANALRRHQIDVWLDREDILPGQRWKDAIRQAIRSGSHFIACFSTHYTSRPKTYMNEELTLAIDELRQLSQSRVWFVPVLLDRCEIPDIGIGRNETLRDFQYVTLFENWEAGFRQILKAIRGARLPAVDAHH
jgi:hypothetical protein